MKIKLSLLLAASCLIPGRLTAQDVNTGTLVRTRDNTTSGSITGNGQSVTISNLQGRSTVTFDVTGTWVGTLSFRASVDGAAYTPVYVFLPQYITALTDLTINVTAILPSGAFSSVRVTSTAWTSGTANIAIRASSASNNPNMFNFIKGFLNHNSGAPGGDNVGALASRATASDPSYTEGNQVLDSVDLAGYKRSILKAETSKVIGTVRNLGNAGAAFDAATGAAPPANVIYVGGLTSGATGGLVAAQTFCDQWVAINGTASAQLITGVSGRKIYFCSGNIQMNGGANTVSFVSGTGSTCGTGTTAVPGFDGATSAANGYSFAANSGAVFGGSSSPFARTTNNADNFCILVGSATRVVGGLNYAIY